ncbi:MAG: homoserine dehydrogenase [Synergistaceae bacterium]|nr:homoserine dehydrogenase [Synergistaceae bacterium]
MEIKIALVGCGNVGTAFIELLAEKRNELKNKFGFFFSLVMVSDKIKGTICNKNGFDIDELVLALHEEHNLSHFEQAKGNFQEVLLASGANFLAECTPTDFETGEPGMSHIKFALDNGISVSTTNKGPIALAIDDLKQIADGHGAKIFCEGTVLSGTPLLDLLKNGLAGCEILEVQGILNGTTNFILSQMEQGQTYEAALKKAQLLGFAEANPRQDVEAFDPAGKVLVLAKLIYGINVDFNSIKRIGITHVTKEMIEIAAKNNHRIKLIAGIHRDINGLHLYVMPRELENTHPLASVNGATNAITLTTDNLGDITLIGPGAGRRETGQALLHDLIEFARTK